MNIDDYDMDDSAFYADESNETTCMGGIENDDYESGFTAGDYVDTMGISLDGDFSGQSFSEDW